ncbi:unnamed protein product [Trichogramma brassicae]|uniref:Uncharacterized protein n=1 Tax=Trichogramma brassicae TaxID=86971 RepID=A0A6H5IUM9_9HYME|nr:unnamed protein product [Trichogramma brassicae]
MGARVSTPSRNYTRIWYHYIARNLSKRRPTIMKLDAAMRTKRRRKKGPGARANIHAGVHRATLLIHILEKKQTNRRSCTWRPIYIERGTSHEVQRFVMRAAEGLAGLDDECIGLTNGKDRFIQAAQRRAHGRRRHHRRRMVLLLCTHRQKALYTHTAHVPERLRIYSDDDDDHHGRESLMVYFFT